MKRTKYFIIIVGACALLLFLLYQFIPPGGFRKGKAKDEISALATEPLLGVYDRKGTFNGDKLLSLQHILIRWNGAGGPADNTDSLRSILAKEKAVLLTIETWPGQDDTKQNILESIADGAFDEKIKTLGNFLSTCPQTILIRLNPEMEVYVNRYPWQKQSPLLYKKAFNHFAALCRKTSPAVKIVWGAAGYPGTDEYWPGGACIDYVSVTLKSGSEQLTKDYPETPSITQLVKRKLFSCTLFR